MGERLVNPEDMASTSTAVATVTPQLQEEPPVERVAVITLRPSRAEPKKKVVWTEDTVDNENMNKKKSKCCCIYEKPRAFDESDSDESDDECEHCFGHVEKKKMKQHLREHHEGGEATVQEAPAPPNPPATIVLRPPTVDNVKPPDRPLEHDEADPSS